jgi:hypothetical protein
MYVKKWNVSNLYIYRKLRVVKFKRWRIHPENVTVSVQYGGTSVHELNPFLEAVREPKCS